MRDVLADTGAGLSQSVFELVLTEADCLSSGGISMMRAQLGGAFTGWFPVYSLRVQIPQLGFDDDAEVVGVPAFPCGVDGIAGFRFLNRFTYGNFGDQRQFGLEL